MRRFSLYSKVKSLVAKRDRGATATEYALIIVAVAAVVAAIVFALGGVIKQQFTDTCSAVNKTNASCSGSSSNS